MHTQNWLRKNNIDIPQYCNFVSKRSDFGTMEKIMRRVLSLNSKKRTKVVLRLSNEMKVSQAIVKRKFTLNQEPQTSFKFHMAWTCHYDFHKGLIGLFFVNLHLNDRQENRQYGSDIHIIRFGVSESRNMKFIVALNSSQISIPQLKGYRLRWTSQHQRP